MKLSECTFGRMVTVPDGRVGFIKAMGASREGDTLITVGVGEWANGISNEHTIPFLPSELKVYEEDSNE